MVEAPIMAGGVSRSAGASPSQSPRSKARLQQKAQALAADLDSKLSVALKARQALPASSWRPEEVPARKSLPPQAVPSKAVKEAAAAALATEAPQQRPQAASLPRIEALETRLEEFVQKLQVEQRAREVFQEELQAKLQVREGKNGSAETHAMDAIKEDVAHLWHELRDRIAAQADLSNAASARDLAELQTRVANCEAANKVMEQKRQRKEMEGPALLQMVTASEEQMQMLRQEVTSVDRRLSQAVNDHCESWQLQMSAVKRDIESLSKATSGVESACQDKVLALSGSYAEVRKEMAAIEESWGARLQDVRSSVKSSEDSLKSIIIKDLEKLEKARPWQKDLAQIQQELSQQIQGKPWEKDLSQQQQEMSQQIQDSAAELSKSIVACQGRLSSARLDTHEKVQGLEERLSHVEKRSSEAREAWLNSEPGLRQVQAALKEVAELRDFTMDQSSKLQNNVQAELSNLEAKVLRECDTTRDFCHEQKQQVGEIHDQLRHELKEAVSNARGVAEELAQEMLRLKQNEEPKLAEQMEELKEKLVTDLVACEARLRTEEDYGQVLGTLADRALWQQSCTLLLEMRFRSMNPFAGTCALAAVACYKAAQHEEAGRIMEKLWSASGRRLDCIDCGTVFTRFQNAGLWQEALAFLEDMRLRRIDPDAYAYNNVMAASRKVNDFSVAPMLLQSMRQQQVQVDAWSYSQAIDASNALATWETSLEYLRELQETQVEGNSVILSAAITACQLGQQPQMARQLLKTARRQGIGPDVQAYTAAITACGTASLWDSALEVLQDMRAAECEPNLFSYNAAMGACQAALEWERALSLYFSLGRAHLTPDTTSYNLLLSSCARCSQREQVEWLVQRMYQQQLSPDEVTFNCLSSLLTERRDREDFLRRLKAAGLRPDVRTYNPMISACAESQGWEEAVTIFDEMMANEVAPDIKSHNRLLDVCATTASWTVVLSLFEELKRAGHDTNTATVNTCIGACASASNWLGAIRLLDRMEKEGPSPDVISYNTALHACRHEGVELAVNMLSRMQACGIDPDVVTFNTVMSSNAEHWEWVLALLANMDQRGLANGRSYRVALCALIKENQLLVALNLLQQMHAKSLPLDTGSYNYLILALLRVGASEWAVHLVQRAIADKVFVKVRPQFLDLHGMSGPVARFCLLLTLRDEALRASSKPLKVITGIGKHSDGAPKVKPEVLSVCQELRLPARLSQDEGSVQVSSKHLTSTLAGQVQRLLSEQELRRHYASLPLIDWDEAVQVAEPALMSQR